MWQPVWPALLTNRVNIGSPKGILTLKGMVSRILYQVACNMPQQSELVA